MLEDLILLRKTRPRELPSSKGLARHHREMWKGEVISLLDLRLGF